MKIARSVFISSLIHLRLQMRSRISWFWSLAFPLILTIGFCSKWIGTETPRALFAAIAPFVAFSVLNFSANGCGISLCSARESGFLRMFAHSRSSKLTYLGSIMLSALLTSLIYGFLIFLSLLLIFHPISAAELSRFLLGIVPATALIGFASIGFNAIRMNLTNIATLWSIVVAPLTILSSSSFDNLAFARVINQINPVVFLNTIFDACLQGDASPLLNLPFLAFVALCLGSGLLGVFMFQIMPVERRS